MDRKEKIKKMLVLQLGLILSGVLVILLIETGIIQVLLPPCITREIFGIICPTCGVTRCVTNMIHFNFETAFMYHPTFFILTIYISFLDVIYILYTLTEKEWLKKLYPNWMLGTGFLIVFIMQYIYRVTMIQSGIGFEFL